MQRIRSSNNERTALDDAFNEAQILVQLDHENVTKLIEFLWDEESPKLYFVLEYCALGPILDEERERLRRSTGDVPSVRSRCVFRSCIHTRGLMHSSFRYQTAKHVCTCERNRKTWRLWHRGYPLERYPDGAENAGYARLHGS